MVIHSDEHYANLPRPMIEAARRTGCYCRPLTPAEELALCLFSRAWILEAHHQYAEAAYWLMHALRFSPDDLLYVCRAARCVGLWLKQTYNAGKPRESWITTPALVHSPELDPRILPAEHVSLAACMLARWHEMDQRNNVALGLYQAAGQWEKSHAQRLAPRHRVAHYFGNRRQRLHSLTRNQELDLYMLGLQRESQS
jgi:hypothetical protein